MWKFALVAVALVAVASSCGRGGGSPPGRIAFVSSRDGDYELWLVSADGSGLQKLTDFGVNPGIGPPAWSPDGRQLFFALQQDGETDSDIYAMSDDGSGLHPITDTPESEYSPMLMPDGNTLIFNRGQEVHLIHTDGSGERLTGALGVLGDLSPDGKQILVTRGERGPRVYAPEAWVTNLDGSASRRLAEEMEYAAAGAWSPDGNKILIECAPKKLIAVPGPSALHRVENEPVRICIINADGSGLVRLIEGNNPRWSPGGQWMTFERQTRLYLARSDGSAVRALTDCDCQEWSAAWSPSAAP